MNDEPHSHKKATVALVAVLLLAYVGSYLWMRRHPSRMWEERTVFRLVVPIIANTERGQAFCDFLYWPLIRLDKAITKKTFSFYIDLGG